MLDAVEVTATMTSELINEIVSQMKATLEHGKKHIKWYTKEVSEVLFLQPYSRPKIVGEAVGKTSRTTLTKYMDELVQAKILTPKKDGTEIYYLNDDLIRILQR